MWHFTLNLTLNTPCAHLLELAHWFDEDVRLPGETDCAASSDSSISLLSSWNPSPTSLPKGGEATESMISLSTKMCDVAIESVESDSVSVSVVEDSGTEAAVGFDVDLSNGSVSVVEASYSSHEDSVSVVEDSGSEANRPLDIPKPVANISPHRPTENSNIENAGNPGYLYLLLLAY